MKFTLSWLLLHLNINLSLQEALDYSMETWLNLGFENEINILNGLYTVKIMKIIDIPGKKIKLCEVLYKDQILNIVCGAPNIQINKLALFAPIGTKINNILIEERLICGIKSEGMLIGVSEFINKIPEEYIINNNHVLYKNEHGIGNNYIIDDSFSLIYLSEELYKQDELFWCEDIIFNIELPTYRSDLCVRGLARELNNHKFNINKVQLKDLAIGKTGETSMKTKIINETNEFFSFMEVYDIEVSSTIKKIMSTLNLGENHLQILNDFILLDIGHPIHIYELNFHELKISLEENKLITKVNNELAAYVGIKGIIGFTEKTSNVLIEAAYINVDSYETASAKTFSIGVDNNQQTLAYILSLINGTSSKIKFTGIKKENKSIFLPQSLVTSITGDTISINKQKNILSAFGFVCNGTAMNRENHKNQEFGLEVIVPSWRNDVKTSHDLISELVRLMGVTFGEMKHVNIKKTETKLNQLRYLLLSKGLREIYTLPFKETGEVQLLNPIDKNLCYLRNNLQKRIHKVFEIGKVYVFHEDNCPMEELNLFICFKKCTEINNWHNKITYDFYYLKELLASLSIYIDLNFNEGIAYEDEDSIGLKLPNALILNTRDDEYVMATIKINDEFFIKEEINNEYNKKTKENLFEKDLLHINVIAEKNILWQNIKHYLPDCILLDIYYMEDKVKYTIAYEKGKIINLPNNIGISLI